MDLTKKSNYILLVIVYAILIAVNIYFSNLALLLCTCVGGLALDNFFIKKKNVLALERQKLMDRIFLFVLFPCVFIVDIVLSYKFGFNSFMYAILFPLWVLQDSLYFRTR